MPEYHTVYLRRWFLVGLAGLALVVAGFAVEAVGWLSGLMGVGWLAAGLLALAGVRWPHVGSVALVLMLILAGGMFGWSAWTGLEYMATDGRRGDPDGIRETFFYIVDATVIIATLKLPPVLILPVMTGARDGGK